MSEERLTPAGISITVHRYERDGQRCLVHRWFQEGEEGCRADWFYSEGSAALILPVDPTTAKIHPPASDALERMYQAERDAESKKYALSDDPSHISRLINRLRALRREHGDMPYYQPGPHSYEKGDSTLVDVWDDGKEKAVLFPL